MDSARRLRYRDAVRMAPVAWLNGEMVTIEGACGCPCQRVDFRLISRPLLGQWAFPSVVRFCRPNAAARRLLEALR